MQHYFCGALIVKLQDNRRGWIMRRIRTASLGRERVILFLCFVLAAMVAAGCQPQGSGFVRKDFLAFKKIAIMPFEGDKTSEVSQAFFYSFKERFPQMEVFDQYRLMQTFKREDLYPNQLSQATRAKIGEMLGAQAVIVGSVFYPSVANWYLQVRVIDTSTGDTLGTSYVDMQYSGSAGMRQGCWLAVQQLTPRE
jgi:hypothetical protein